MNSSKVSENVYVSYTKDGYYALEFLLNKGKKIDRIITLPKENSKGVSDYANFQKLALKFNLQITHTADINRLTPFFSKKRPNIIIVNGWSQLLNRKLLDTALNGCIGTHPSLLPKNRGRSPIPWHFINEETYGGVSLFYLRATSDSGPIINQIAFKIKDTDNASSYYSKITRLGAELLLKNFDSLVDGSAKNKAIPQDESKATFLLKRRPKDSYIDFNKYSAREIHNLVRAVSDVYPLAYFFHRQEKFLVLSSNISNPFPKFSGIPGQIARVYPSSIWVLSKDQSIVALDKILDEERRLLKPKDYFKPGDVLNE